MTGVVRLEKVEGPLSKGAYLKRKILLEGQNVNDFALLIGVHPQTLYNVTRPERPRRISAQLALTLSQHFAEGVGFWLSPEPVPAEADATPSTGVHTNTQRPSAKAERGAASKLISSSSCILVDKDIAALLADPLNNTSLTPSETIQIEPASVDLTFGLIMPAHWRSIAPAKWATLQKWHYSDRSSKSLNEEARKILEIAKASEEETIVENRKIDKNESVFVLARQEVKFSKKHLARVGAVAENVMRGLQVTHGLQVDPGFNGPFFVIVTNLCEDSIYLKEGDKLVSLEIHRLAYAPDEAHKSEAFSKCAGIAVKLTNKLQEFFEYKPLDNGSIKASSEYFTITPVASDEFEVKGETLDLMLQALRAPSKTQEANLKFWEKIDAAADNIAISRNEAKALGVYFNIPRQKNKAIDWFKTQESQQTLKDTIDRMDLNIREAIVRLTEGAAE